MKRPAITEAIKKGLESLPLDIEVWLYGSEARGDARPDSDIDLLVLFNKPNIGIDDKDKIPKFRKRGVNNMGNRLLITF